MSDKDKQKAITDFRRGMEKLGLGVKIKAGDGPWITVVEDPEQAATENNGEDEPPTIGKVS
jgi:hypothetical protein